MNQKRFVPPDGGWGWVIVVAFAVNTVISIPIMTSFGLIFKDTFKQIGLSAMDTSIIINTNQAFGMMMGLVNAILLNKFGYRKVAMVSAVCMISGVILTAFASSFVHFLISFGLLTSLGMGLGMSSYSLALNTYFLKNRGKATGIAFTITGLGPIGMPQLISYLMNNYGPRGAVLILTGIVAHTFPAACLLQPVKWHLKSEEADENNHQNVADDDTKKPFLDQLPKSTERSVSINSGGSLTHRLNSGGFQIGRSLPSLNKDNGSDFSRVKWWSSLSSIPSVNLASSVKIFEEKEKPMEPCSNENKKIEDGDEKPQLQEQILKQNNKEIVYNPHLSAEKKHKKLIDLELLTDKTFLNIIIGISLAVFAEMNFSLLTPFMLAEFEFGTSQIATFMSVIAVADLSFRFISPFIGDYFRKTPRIMYLSSLVVLITARFAFILVSTFKAQLLIAAVLGISKGVRTVYMTLVVPSYVPLDKLASASGIQMVISGCVFVCGGPLIGFIRNITGTYRKCVVLMNFITFLTILMWSTEMIYRRYKSKRSTTNDNGFILN